jgi:acetylornithine deacetylase/succinyl-diaminopimelate desuccinylase-like protein
MVLPDSLSEELGERLPQTVEAIREAVRHPSVSPERRGGAEYASFLRDLYLEFGCEEAEIVETGDDWPGVWAFLDGGSSSTVVTYSYFDTYGVDEAAWTHPPFGGDLGTFDTFPKVVFGRGAGVKGSHIAWVAALSALRAAGNGLPANVLFLSEGAEMMGSPNFGKIVAAASHRLGSVSAMLSPRASEALGSPEVPVVLGYKNMVTFELACRAPDWGRGPAGGRIFGNSKSVVDSPVHRLIQAVASLLTADGNGVEVDGLREDFARRKVIEPWERELFAQLVEKYSGKDWSEVLPTTAGVRAWSGNLSGEDVLREYMYGPSISVSEIRSAAAAESPQLTMLLPQWATAELEIRLVTEKPAADVVADVQRHLRHQGFPEIAVRPIGLWDGWQTPPDEPLVAAVLGTLERYGKRPVVWPMQPFGGPWAGLARELEVPSITGSALGYTANGGAGSDEFYVIDSDERVAGLNAAQLFMCDLFLTYRQSS